MSRYKVIEESVLGHNCCFEATVVDTSIATEWREFSIVCECFDLQTARRIAAALNAQGEE